MNTLEYIKDKFEIVGNEIHGINRSIMAKFLGDSNLKYGVEIGVAEGYHAKILLEAGCDIYGVDCYRKYPGYEEYRDPESICKSMLEFLAPYGDRFKLIKEFSFDAAKRFDVGSNLDFVYIDGGHDFLNVAQDIALWTPFVKHGGVVFGHDYKHRAYQHKNRYPVHVQPVVDAFVRSFELQDNFFVLANDIKDPTFGRDNRGWLIVKP